MNNLNKDNKSFSSAISQWYLTSGRNNLPWREKISPYRVWISEIMLQQTQVKTVIPFFKKFIRKYPNLKSICDAKEDDILALWSGLGFYRRAKNIFKAKEIIKNKYNNCFPKKFDELLLLPGIGRSTAGAIMSIAYGESYPILDANVKRVISRFNDIDVKDKGAIKSLWLLSKTYTPSKNIFEYTQGIMDLGATICHLRVPSCSDCPLHTSCKSSFKEFKVIKNDKKQKLNKKINFMLAHSNQSFLLFKKNKKSFWESLWIPYERQNRERSDLFKRPLRSETKNFNHALSHIDLNITLEIFEYKEPFKIKTNLEHKWVKKDELNKFGLPKPIKSIIENYV